MQRLRFGDITQGAKKAVWNTVITLHCEPLPCAALLLQRAWQPNRVCLARYSRDVWTSLKHAPLTFEYHPAAHGAQTEAPGNKDAGGQGVSGGDVS
jgi:hypothetical protein